MLDLVAVLTNEWAVIFRKDEVIETEEVSVYDVKIQSNPFRLGSVFVRVESSPVCHFAINMMLSSSTADL